MAAICCKVCTLPCEALGHACHACDKGCSCVCKQLCNCSCCPEDRPSPLFLSYTLMTNVPIILGGLVLAIVSASDYSDCGGSFMNPIVWLLVCAALGIFFVLFAAHIYRVFSQPYNQALDGPDLERNDFTSRACHTACHDVVVFLYFFVAPAAFIWAILGFSIEENDECPDSVQTGVQIMSIIMLVYIIGTIFVGMVSCCWETQRVVKAPKDQGGHKIPFVSAAMGHLARPGFTGPNNGSDIPHANAPPAPYRPPVAQHMNVGPPQATETGYPAVHQPTVYTDMHNAHAAQGTGYSPPPPPQSDGDKLKAAATSAAKKGGEALNVGMSKFNKFMNKKGTSSNKQ